MAYFNLFGVRTVQFGCFFTILKWIIWHLQIKTFEGGLLFQLMHTTYKHHSTHTLTSPCSMLSLPEKPEPIDWDRYRKLISTPGLVDSYQKQYESLTVPYPKDVDTPIIEKHRKEFVSIVTSTSIECYSVSSGAVSELLRVPSPAPGIMSNTLAHSASV